MARQTFDERLTAALDALPLPAGSRRYGVAFSGGLDSMVLLAALRRLLPGGAVRALHVNHGLHHDSAAWEARCRATAERLGVEYRSRRVSVDLSGGAGVEAPAREARYAALADMMRAGEVLLTAHHADDQLETLLLRLLRGAGVRGLRGIALSADFPPGHVARPLLGFTRAELEAEARTRELAWVDDPANLDQRYDRNYLRAEVLPPLVRRWPGAAQMASRLALRMAEAERLLEGLAEEDAAGIDDPRRVPRRCLLELPAERERNLLRHLIRRAALPVPDARQLEEIRAALRVERADAAPCVRWRGGEARLFRDRLYLLEPLVPLESLESLAPLELGPGAPAGARVAAERPWCGPQGRVRLEPGGRAGLPESWARTGLEVRFRRGGERFRPAGSAQRRALKQWLREAAVVPWMRERLPLLYHRGQLVAVAGLWVSAEAAEALPDEPRWQVMWENRPPLH